MHFEKFREEYCHDIFAKFIIRDVIGLSKLFWLSDGAVMSLSSRQREWMTLKPPDSYQLNTDNLNCIKAKK
jgi:hypothetical protein